MNSIGRSEDRSESRKLKSLYYKPEEKNTQYRPNTLLRSTSQANQNDVSRIEKMKCSKKVFPSEYERTSLENRKWWQNIFDILESEIAIPTDQRWDIVRELFPDETLRKMLRQLTLYRSCKEDSIYPRKDEEAPIEFPDFEKSPKEHKGPKRCITEPYSRFFRLRPERAAIWHTLPPLSFDEMTLAQKAEAITTSLAEDFVHWVESISDEDSPTSLTVPLVLKMFEIGFDTHAAKSLQIRVKEMPSVPDGVALLKGIPEMAKRSQLRKQIYRNLKAAQQEHRLFAFGSRLGREEQVVPPRIEEIKLWLECKSVPQDLESMAVVWQGITHLRSTRAFCEYLLEHLEIPPPKYLFDMKMLDKETLKSQKPITPVKTESSGDIMEKMGVAEKKNEAPEEFLVIL